jgi:hypothetical protein
LLFAKGKNHQAMLGALFSGCQHPKAIVLENVELLRPMEMYMMQLL